MKNYFLLLLTVASIHGYSQNSLSGRVAIKNGDALQTTIYISQLEKGTITNLEGHYKISNIPSGTYSVVYSSLGYETVSEKLTFLKNGEIVNDIILIPSAIEMEEVIISTPFHKLQRNNVMKVERLSAKELTESGAATLSEGITNIAGVSTISTGTGIGKPVIRGLSSNRVLTYTQGVRLENQQFGDEHGLGINGEGIESVEVIKGPASLLYGSDALGGVLYINPERFAGINKTKASIKSTYFSNTLGFSNSIGFKASNEKFKYLLRGTHATYSDYKTGTGKRVTLSRFNETDIKTGIRFQNEKLKTTFRYNFNQSNIGIPEEIGFQTTTKKIENPFQQIDNHILSLNTTFFLKKSSVDIKIGYLFNDRKEFEEDNIAALRLRLNTLNYDVKYNLPDFGKFETIVGVQGLYQTNTNLGEEVLIPDATKTDFGIMATSHFHLKKIDIQGGLRFDTRKISSTAVATPIDAGYIAALNLNFTSFNTAIGVKADINEMITARLNFASGFRAPNLAELTSNGIHEGTNRYEIGDASLNNEQNFQTDLALEYTTDHFEVFANGFYNVIKDFIFIQPTGEIIEENFVFSYLQENAKLYGGEFGVHFHPHPLDWLHINSDFETVTGKQNNGSYLPLIPANKLTNTIKVEFNDGKNLTKPYLFVRSKSTFKQNNNSEFETKTNGYTLVSLGGGVQFSYRKSLFIAAVSITNLTDESYIAHLSRLKVDGIQNPGRNVSVSLKVLL